MTTKVFKATACLLVCQSINLLGSCSMPFYIIPLLLSAFWPLTWAVLHQVSILFKQTCVYHCSLFISHRRERTLQQGLTQWKQGSSPECCTCSDIEAGMLKANLEDYCKDKDEASDVLSVSHNPAIIITLYANAEQVGNYSWACFTLLVLPDLGLKHNSARIHIKYRAKPHRWALSKGLWWLWGQGLWRAMQERCHFGKLSGPRAVSFWRGRHMRSCVYTVCIQTRRWRCSLRDNSLSPGFVKLFSAAAFWG